MEKKVRIGTDWVWQGFAKRELFCKIAGEILLPVVKGDIIIEVPHSRVVEPLKDGAFHIYIWSSPENPEIGQIAEKTPETIWGIKVDCRDAGFESSGLGIAIVAEEENWDVGELVNNNLYIHHDLCHGGTENELAIFRRLCQEVSEIITGDTREKESPEEKLKRSREQYIKECQGRPERVIAQLEKDIDEGEKNIRRLQRDLVFEIRKANNARLKLKNLQSRSAENTGKYGDEFDAMLKIPGIEGMSVRPRIINLYTEHIYIPIKVGRIQKALDIGKFRIEILTQTGKIKFFNMTRRGTGDKLNIIHPHVDSYGLPCLGNIKEMVPELIANYEFSALAQIALQWLKSVELEEHENPTRYWPVVDWPIKEKKVNEK